MVPDADSLNSLVGKAVLVRSLNTTDKTTIIFEPGYVLVYWYHTRRSQQQR